MCTSFHICRPRILSVNGFNKITLLWKKMKQTYMMYIIQILSPHRLIFRFFPEKFLSRLQHCSTSGAMAAAIHFVLVIPQREINSVSLSATNEALSYLAATV